MQIKGGFRLKYLISYVSKCDITFTQSCIAEATSCLLIIRPLSFNCED